ncbi:MAG TPA: methyltransferase domain-containing protein [Candidatus Limnocylindrales bacterium]|nr:methyltransferase domain-containing protein [Candidatus Limnocylindrales bacterium]
MSDPRGPDHALKAELIASWDRGARGYDATPRHGLLHDDEWRAWRRLLAALLGDARHSDVPARRVLDVGTGTGVIALLAAELGHDVTGVDLSEGMLAQARAKASASGLAVEWRTADAEGLPPDLVGFDAVVARHLVWTLPRPDRALASWRDAARAGGLVVVIDGVVRRPPPPFDGAQRAIGRLAARLSTASHPERGDHAYPSEARARLPLAEQRDTTAIVALMRAVGLERVRVRPTPEIDRIERARQPLLERLGDPWRRYVATARTPILTAAEA